MPVSLPIALLLLLNATPTFAAEVKVSGVIASTSLPGADGVTYEATNVTDRRVSTVWVEGDTEGSGLGSWVQLEFNEPKTVTGFTIWNGNWYSWDFWKRHNRPKEIEVELTDGSVHKFTLKDEKTPEHLDFPKPITTSSLKVKVKSIYRGSTFNDTCISEIVVYDNAPEVWHMPAVTNDSGHLAEDADGSYKVSNTYDGLLDTMWCENQPKGDGTGTFMEYRFGKTVPIGKVILRNGNAYGIAESLKSNMATAATLEFSDGSREEITLKPMIIEQGITFPTRNVESVRVRFTAVKKGTEYNDLCISELKFTER
jgi:hypothetical protein